MKPLDCCALADLLIEIAWEKNRIHHTEIFLAENVNSYRDSFPGSIFEKWPEPSRIKETFVLSVKPGEPTGPYDPKRVVTLPLSRLVHSVDPGSLRPGSYYPQGIISGLPGVFTGTLSPFRLKELTPSDFTADLNHPMADVGMKISIRFLGTSLKPCERGGTSTDWMDIILKGPGMQALDPGSPTHPFCGPAFDRTNADPDEDFYKTNRFVHHIDTTASKNLADLYSRFLKTGDRVLDLMAGWISHLPEHPGLASVYGLGMNAAEMKDNPSLTRFIVQNLNRNPVLPYPDHFFDTILCSLSVEYLTDPVPVFKEAARVLKPGGNLVMGFSNRWFPEKAIRIWADLHEFERLGLVTRFFMESNRFHDIETLSVRGYPRPVEDKYFPRLREADPVYVVAGKSD